MFYNFKILLKFLLSSGMFSDEGSCLFSVDRVVVQHGQRTDVLITPQSFPKEKH